LTIKKRLILSNLGMIIIPAVSILVVDACLGYLLFVVFKGSPEGETLKLLIRLRIIAAVMILILTNGLLTYSVAKHILNPIAELAIAAKKISEGNFDYRVKSKANDELGELARTFETMRRKLKEAQATQKQYEKNRQELIAGISHDLKTPITTVKGYLKGIQDGLAKTPEKLDQYIHVIQKAVDNMEALISELFLYSKLDLKQIPFHFEQVDLYPFFVDVIEELSFQLEKENGTATLLADPTQSYIVKADREKLKRVVSNIIQNSLKYMDKQEKNIRVRLSSQPNAVMVEIQDNGRGIKQEDLPYIFDRFYRTDPSRNRATGGSGLGLSIAKKIIEAHRGTIWAESEWGKGTTIYFKLYRVIP